MSERQEIEQAIIHLEIQRDLLGDVTVDAALVGLHEKLAALGKTVPGEPSEKP